MGGADDGGRGHGHDQAGAGARGDEAADEQVITRATMTIVTWLASIILAAGLTAALHVHIGLRIVGLVFLLSPLTPLLALRPVACLLGIAGILLFFLIRARGRKHRSG